MSSGEHISNRASISVIGVKLYDFELRNSSYFLKVLQKILRKLQSRKVSKALNEPERA